MKKGLLFNLFTVIFCALTFTSCQPKNEEAVDKNAQETWWKEAVVYQIYPRSYADSNGDGIGDLRGIINHLDYIKSLGVDVVWLNPIFSSPNDDNGYDISDYTGIMKDFGTLADFDELLKGLHNRGIKCILDLVVNHSSDEHKWFQESRKSRNNPYRDYYHWWPAEKGKPAARHSDMDPDQSAWCYDSLTNAYYFHIFSRKQPDLNWENPKMRQDFYKGMRFWLDKGVDGFRVDASPYISKDTNFPEIDRKKYPNDWAYYSTSPHVHEYMQEMNREVLSHYDVMTVGESNEYVNPLDFTDANRGELNMIYANPYARKDKLQELRRFFSHADSVYATKGWPTVILGNHDIPRMVSFWGNDAPEYRALSSKLLTTFLMTMRGTVYFYNGDEIGMDNIRFNSIDEYNDLITKNQYIYHQKYEGQKAADAYLEDQKEVGRDNARTPMQWNASSEAGFTSGATTWLKVNPDFISYNVESQEKDPNSILNYFRKAVQFRHAHKALVYGTYQALDTQNAKVYSFLRTYEKEKYLVVLNFSNETATTTISGIDLKQAKVVLGNYPTAQLKAEGAKIELQPWEALVVKI